MGGCPVGAGEPPAVWKAAPLIPPPFVADQHHPEAAHFAVSRLTLVVHPENAEIEIEGVRVQQSGRTRYLQTPPLSIGGIYQYRITARWPDGRQCQRDVTFRAGEEITVVLNAEQTGTSAEPDKPERHANADDASGKNAATVSDLLNFGLDLVRLQERQGRPAGAERFLWRGREISRAEAEALLSGQSASGNNSSGRTVPDDSQLPHLTIISRDLEQRRKILNDLASAPELAAWRGRYRVQSYPADHWIVPRLKLNQDANFAASGLAIVVQPPAGPDGTSQARICYRYDGPAALAAWLQNQPVPSAWNRLPAWVYLALAALALVWLGQKRAAQSGRPGQSQGSKPMSMLNGYKTYIAALLAAFVAFNHVVPLVSPEVEKAILAAATALGLYGLRHALERIEQNTLPRNPA
jgi:uncharacterized protein (TIGR03000 family)